MARADRIVRADRRASRPVEMAAEPAPLARGSSCLCIADVVCSCGSPLLVLVAPGSIEERSETGILVRRGVPTRGWCCMAHFLADSAQGVRIRAMERVAS